MPIRLDGSTGITVGTAVTIGTSDIKVGNNVDIDTTSIVGVTTIGVTTAYVTSINDGPISGMRNRIINGDMRVDQRNGGASISVTGNGFVNRGFPVDRFTIQKSSSCTLTGIQTSDVPTGQGFSYAIRVGVSSADASIGASDNAFINHRVEGYNVADFDYGLSSAKTVTVSFWVKSSIAGTYGFGLSNYADNRSIPIEYTINSSDTWEYKTITISGDTTGTWEKTNSGGLNMAWVFGAGTDNQGTNNTWGISVKFSTSSQTQLISTLNATFFLTGVQLEVGTVASPFERRSFGQELFLCQRYYRRHLSGFGKWTSTTNCQIFASFPVPMRTTPISGGTPSGVVEEPGVANRTISAIASIAGNEYGGRIDLTTSSATSGATGGTVDAIIPLSAEL